MWNLIYLIVIISRRKVFVFNTDNLLVYPVSDTTHSRVDVMHFINKF